MVKEKTEVLFFYLVSYYELSLSERFPRCIKSTNMKEKFAFTSGHYLPKMFIHILIYYLFAFHSINSPGTSPVVRPPFNPAKIWSKRFIPSSE